MLANWMLYCAAVGVLLGGGAIALERGLRALGRPTRWAWAAAMVLALAIPAVVRLAPAPAAAPVPGPLAVSSAGAAVRVPRPAAPPAPKVRTPSLPTARGFDLGAWDPALRVAWGVSSAAVLLALAAMGAVLARRRRGWVSAEVDGVSVLVSADVGPAVVGLVRSRIVLPAWTLEADEEARRLVLEHEREHVRAGDPRLLAAALLLAALTPWNPAAWWMLRRLRLAIEVDCDARVLRRRADVRSYGSTLLEIGRRAVRAPLPAAAFAEPVSSLERRIRIMTAPRARRPLLRAAVCGALAALLVGAACETPGPLQPSTAGGRRMYAAEGEAAGLPRAKISLREVVSRYFPEVARQGLGDDEYLVVTASADGDIVGHERLPRAPDADRAATAVPGHKIAVRGQEGAMVMLFANENTVRSIDRMVEPAGAVAPTPLTIVWVQLKGPGDESRATRYSSSNPDAEPGDPFGPGQFSSLYRGDGTTVIIGARGTAVGTLPSEAEIVAAMDRFITPELRAGAHQLVTLGFRVSADGRATDVAVAYGQNPALIAAARSALGTLSFAGVPVGTEVRISFAAGSARSGPPLPRPRGPK
ncbi:MAG: M56 family metallopeptidase [Longimicrobiaceae bacterium]